MHRFSAVFVGCRLRVKDRVTELPWKRRRYGDGAVAIVILPHTGDLAEKLLLRIPLPERWRGPLIGLAEQVLSGLRVFHHWGRFTGFTLLTVVIWVMDAVGVITGGLALGLTIPFRMALLLLTGLGLGSALPSTPGYVGIYQFVAVTVLTPFGIGRDEALAYILVAMASVLVLACGLNGTLPVTRDESESVAAAWLNSTAGELISILRNGMDQCPRNIEHIVRRIATAELRMPMSTMR